MNVYGIDSKILQEYIEMFESWPAIILITTLGGIIVLAIFTTFTKWRAEREKNKHYIKSTHRHTIKHK